MSGMNNLQTFFRANVEQLILLLLSTLILILVPQGCSIMFRDEVQIRRVSVVSVRCGEDNNNPMWSLHRQCNIFLADAAWWYGVGLSSREAISMQRYPGGFRLHISTAGDQTLSSNVPTEQFYQGLPPVLRSGEDWMTWQQLTDLTWLTSNLKLIISKSIIRQTNALHKKNKARLIKKKVSSHWTGNSRAVMGWRGEVTQWEITLNRQTPLVWKEAHSSHS